MPKHVQLPPTSPNDAPDRRSFRRISARIEGRIVFAGVDVDCIVHEMSATGAVIECRPLPASGASIALDVPEVGFALGHVIRHEDNLVCVELTTAPARRNKLADKLILAAFKFPPDA
ncbi:MAG: PilZ domain-containing protein [Parvibaculum sp.]|nr:PilZ domain-containing protein [Parvibaculum sp.]